MAKNGADPLTIDQLARRTGMTVRNIRAHQSRGLLTRPPSGAGPVTTTVTTWPASSLSASSRLMATAST